MYNVHAHAHIHTLTDCTWPGSPVIHPWLPGLPCSSSWPGAGPQLPCWLPQPLPPGSSPPQPHTALAAPVHQYKLYTSGGGSPSHPHQAPPHPSHTQHWQHLGASLYTSVKKSPVLKQACPFKQAFWKNRPFFKKWFCPFFVTLSTFNVNSHLLEVYHSKQHKSQ